MSFNVARAHPHAASRLILTLFVAVCFAVAALAAAPHRIVSLSPNLTEILYGIGAFPQVAGVSDYCTYPPEAARLPSIGGWDSPSLEKLAALRPDLAVVDDAEAPFIQDNFRKLGLRLLVLPARTVQDVYSAMAQLGKATGHEQDAAKLIATTREGLARVAQKTAHLPHPRVVMIVDRTPGTLQQLYTATTGGFLAELVAIAGGQIAVPPASGGYGKLSEETLLAANPDVILDFAHSYDGKMGGNPVDAWSEMAQLKAVRTHRVYAVNEDYVPHASQRMVLTAELFARLIHPEAR